jgi:hypothetical protein
MDRLLQPRLTTMRRLLSGTALAGLLTVTVLAGAVRADEDQPPLTEVPIQKNDPGTTITYRQPSLNLEQLQVVRTGQVPTISESDPGAALVSSESDEAIVVSLDSDGDGLSDDEEAALGTNPYDADTDDDGRSDGWEVANGFDPLTWNAR